MQDILQDHVPSVEDTVDILTLPDNTESKDNYGVALDLLAGAGNSIPKARLQSARNSVWRRMYIHDKYDSSFPLS